MTAIEFYTAFKSKMREDIKGNDGVTTYFDIYKSENSVSPFTQLIKKIVTEIIQGVYTSYDEKNEQPLTAEYEYLRIDCIGYEQRISEVKDEAKNVGLKAHFWDLKVAVEYENKSEEWTDEVIKLAHIRCPLKVVIGYCHCDQRGDLEMKKLDTVGNWIKQLGVYEKECNDELLVILGNSKGANGSTYESFDYSGYVYDYDKGKFIPLNL